MSSQSLVLVTGASGFVASHIVQLLLKEGYQVRGTVRDPNNKEKTAFLRALPGAEERLELVQADLLTPESWASAVKGCKYVLHTASPFLISEPKDEKELIEPAVNGTTSVLRAVAEYNGTEAKSEEDKIARVVVTSSVVSISAGYTKDKSKANHVFTEEDWTNTEKTNAYAKSKTLAEQAAWKLLKELPEEKKFELATINPSYVQGPMLNTRGGESSSLLVLRFLKNDLPGVPKLGFSIVDVRDVATAHLRAMTVPEAAGQRFICSSEDIWFSDISKYMNTEFGSARKPTKGGYKIATMGVPKAMIWLVSWFDKGVAATLDSIGKQTKYNNAKAREVLGIKFRPARESILEMAHSVIDLGLVPDKRPKD